MTNIYSLIRLCSIKYLWVFCILQTIHDLLESSSAKFKMVVGHHPIHSFGKHGKNKVECWMKERLLEGARHDRGGYTWAYACVMGHMASSLQVNKFLTELEKIQD